MTRLVRYQGVPSSVFIFQKVYYDLAFSRNTKYAIRCGSRICVRGGGPAEILPTLRSGVAVAAKFWASKWGVRGGGPGPQAPPLDPHLAIYSTYNRCSKYFIFLKVLVPCGRFFRFKLIHRNLTFDTGGFLR